ncbi:hypothetical protein AS593_06875 [Caulobacter vibrioides]|nr:hypothetical protein AS593_06875 [Caulobacter vibrioides]
MLVVETVAKIRREHCARGKGVKTIAREMGLARNGVRKILRSGDTALEYELSEGRPSSMAPRAQHAGRAGDGQTRSGGFKRGSHASAPRFQRREESLERWIPEWQARDGSVGLATQADRLVPPVGLG